MMAAGASSVLRRLLSSRRFGASRSAGSSTRARSGGSSSGSGSGVLSSGGSVPSSERGSRGVRRHPSAGQGHTDPLPARAAPFLARRM